MQTRISDASTVWTHFIYTWDGQPGSRTAVAIAKAAISIVKTVKHSDLMDTYTQAKSEESPLSRDQRYKQYGKKIANVHAKLEAKETGLEAIHLRRTDTEKGWNESKAEIDTLRTQISTDEDRVMRRLTEHMRAMIEAEMSSLRRKEKSREPIVATRDGCHVVGLCIGIKGEHQRRTYSSRPLRVGSLHMYVR